MTVDVLEQETTTTTPAEVVTEVNGENEFSPGSNPSESEDSSSEPATAAPAKKAKAKASTAKKTRTVELTLTVTGTADGEWQAELKQGSKWVARGLEISAAAVSRAAKELHNDISVPIDEMINAARAQQQAKVAQLEAELEQAKLILAELEE